MESFKPLLIGLGIVLAYVCGILIGRRAKPVVPDPKANRCHFEVPEGFSRKEVKTLLAGLGLQVVECNIGPDARMYVDVAPYFPTSFSDSPEFYWTLGELYARSLRRKGSAS